MCNKIRKADVPMKLAPRRITREKKLPKSQSKKYVNKV
jgi:hypothetical protein